MTLKRLYHISDIHIRLIKRHDEYQSVFKTLYSELTSRYQSLHDGSSDPSAMIVLTGDVVHTKTDMSPEMVSLASEFLRNLSDIMPVLVIPGNHDVNLNSPNRLDALSPIISNLNRSNIHYLRESQIWSYQDVEFYHYSLLDNNHPSIIDKSTAFKVGLFHGTVSGAKTDVGYEMTDRGTTLDKFRGLDFVLLGDIHRYQVLQSHRSDSKGTYPEVAYASSLIQQNYGETLNYHGFVEWDLENKTHTFVEIENEYGFVTVAINDGMLIEPENITYPQNIRLRFIVNNSTMNDVKKLEREFRKNHKLLEVTLSSTSTTTDSSNITATGVVDLYDVEEQEARIREHLSGWTEEQITDVLELNSEFNTKITPDDAHGRGTWKLKSLYFDNMFSYGKGNFINFENIHGINGFFAPNASGKTSLINILCFALYDKTSAAFKGNHIINSRSDECYCQLIYTFGDDTYRIERRGKYTKLGAVKFDVEFSKLENDQWTSLNGTDRRDTNRVIREYIGNFDDLLLTTLSTQKQDGLFVDLGQADRREVLSRFLGLTVFPKLENAASGALKELELEKKIISVDVVDGMVEELEEKETAAQRIITESSGIITTKRQSIEEYQKSIRSAAEKKIPISFKHNIDDLLRRRDQLEKLVSLSGTDINELIDNIEKLKNEHSRLEQKSRELDILEKRFTQEYLSLLDKKRVVERECSSLESIIRGKQQTIDNLSNYQFNPDCEFCVNNVFVQEAYTARDTIGDVRETLLQKQSELEGVISELQEKQYLEAAHQEWGVVVSDLLSVSNNISKLQETLAIKTLHKTTSNEALETTMKNIEEYHTHEKNVLLNTELDTLINMYESHLRKDQAELSAREAVVSRATMELETIRERLKSHEELQKKIESIDSKIALHKMYLGVVCSNGLPYRIISSYVETLQTSINTILANVVDFTIAVTADDKTIDLEIVYDSQRKWALELGSGMERFIAGIAIRIALSEISSVARGNFFIVDEGLGSLDAENRQTIHKLFDVLRDKFDIILLISHLDTVRDMTERHLTVDKDQGWSKILIK